MKIRAETLAAEQEQTQKLKAGWKVLEVSTLYPALYIASTLYYFQTFLQSSTMCQYLYPVTSQCLSYSHLTDFPHSHPCRHNSPQHRYTSTTITTVNHQAGTNHYPKSSPQFILFVLPSQQIDTPLSWIYAIQSTSCHLPYSSAQQIIPITPQIHCT